MPGTYISPAETGLYYLQSRYYNPETGRFLNADAFTTTGQGLAGNNMFTYCGNNPVMGYDPSGLINWGGVAVGLGIGLLAIVAVAVTVATAGAASPLVAAAGTAVGTTISGALVEAATVTTIGAVAEAPVVYDVTLIDGNNRMGVSLVYDYGENTSDLYGHTGVQNKSEYGFTVGSGFVFNYDKPGDYAGEFYDISGSTKYKGASLGFDYCTDPDNFCLDDPFSKGSHAILLTAGGSVSFVDSRIPTFAYDYYWQLS